MRHVHSICCLWHVLLVIELSEPADQERMDHARSNGCRRWQFDKIVCWPRQLHLEFDPFSLTIHFMFNVTCEKHLLGKQFDQQQGKL